MDLQNRVAMISGASGGSGRVVAKTLAENGARLVLLGRNRERLEQLAAELGVAEERILTLAVDLGEPQASQKAVTAVMDKFGQLDIVVHLVGGWTGGASLVDTAVADFAGMLDQHLWTSLYLLQAAIPALQDNAWGRVMVVSSPLAGDPSAKMGPYAIGKAAQEALIATMAQEVKGSGLTANILRVKTIDVKHARIHEPSSKTRPGPRQKRSPPRFCICVQIRPP